MAQDESEGLCSSKVGKSLSPKCTVYKNTPAQGTKLSRMLSFHGSWRTLVHQHQDGPVPRDETMPDFAAEKCGVKQKCTHQLRNRECGRRFVRAPTWQYLRAGDKNNRNLMTGLRKLTLQVEAAQTGQTHVEDKTAWCSSGQELRHDLDDAAPSCVFSQAGSWKNSNTQRTGVQVDPAAGSRPPARSLGIQNPNPLSVGAQPPTAHPSLRLSRLWT